jgi:hypothetical protein
LKDLIVFWIIISKHSSHSSLIIKFVFEALFLHAIYGKKSIDVMIEEKDEAFTLLGYLLASYKHLN